MTPQEKAKDLIEKFYTVHPTIKVGTIEQIKNGTQTKIYTKSRKCALIAVDEILDGFRKLLPSSRNYWEEVKQHLQ